MADNFISGNDGYVKLDANEYAFGEWEFPIDGGTKRFFAFGSDFQRTLPGGKAAQISMKGAYNQGNMPLVVGVVYDLHLGWEVGVELSVSARVDKITYSNKVSAGGEPGGQCTVQFESDGPFTVDFT